MQDQELLIEIKTAVQEERNATTEVLHLLMEIEKRKLFAERGYDSLFAFVVGFLGYSEPAAHRRIAAMRAIKEFPNLETKINSGDLSLTNLAQVQVALRQEAKARGALGSSAKLELFSLVEKKSTRECEKIILSRLPEAVPRERRREITENKTELKMVLDESTVQLLQKIKELWSHKNPAISDSELVKAMAEFCLSKIDPEQKKIKQQDAPTETPAPESLNKISAGRPGLSSGQVRTRHIPTQVQAQIWKRDQGQCQFRDPLTKKLCGSRRFIEIDHIHPWALGGTHDPQNLRLLCRTHNALTAEKVFGPFKNSAQMCST